jgi:hypothetical protein
MPHLRGRASAGIVRYATLMENLSEAMRTGVGVPAHIKRMAPLPEALKQALIKLMSDGAELERGLQQRIEAGRPRRPQKAKVPKGPVPKRCRAIWGQKSTIRTDLATRRVRPPRRACYLSRQAIVGVSSGL